MQKLGTGYTKYFNQKNDRSGSLFEGPFKAIHIENEEYILWLSGYINGNTEIHKIAKAANYKWCSFAEYLKKEKDILCKKEIILSQFRSPQDYRRFVDMVIARSALRKDMEKHFIEEL